MVDIDIYTVVSKSVPLASQL